MTDVKTNWTGVLFGFAIAVAVAYQQFKLPPILPEMLNTYGYSRVMAGSFMSIYAIAGILVSLAVGNAMHKMGATVFIYLTFTLCAAGSILTLMVPENGWIVLTGRGLEGVGVAIGAVIGPSFATRFSSPKHLPIASAILATWVPVGSVAAALFALWFAARSTPNTLVWPFIWKIGLFSLALLFVWCLKLHKSGKLDLSLKQNKADDVESPAETIDPLATSKRLALNLTSLIFLLWAWQNVAYMTWLPDYLVSYLGFSDRSAIALYTIPLIVVALFNLLAAPILNMGFRPSTILMVALLGQAAVLLLTPIYGKGGSGLLLLIFYGVFAGVTPTCLFSLPGRIFGQGKAGPRAFGVMMTGRNIGIFTGPLSIALMVTFSNSWNATPISIGIVALGASTIAYWLHRVKKKIPTLD